MSPKRSRKETAIQSLRDIAESAQVERPLVLGVAVGLDIKPELIGTSYVFTDKQAERILSRLKANPPPRKGTRTKARPLAASA